MVDPIKPYLGLQHVDLFYPVDARVASTLMLSTRSKRRHLGCEIIQLGFRRFALAALRDVTVSLYSGDRLALIGANGAGKSTLLRMMAGIYYPDRGSRTVFGSISTLFNLRLGFNMEQSGIENIKLRCLLSGWSRKQIKERQGEIAENTGLGNYVHLPLRTYSSGMLARLAFTICTSQESGILLMDEWIGAGDENFMKLAKERLTRYVENTEIVVLASHNPGILRQICNRAIVMSSGSVVFEGSVEDGLKYQASMPA